jgi:hypothetical protein
MIHAYDLNCYFSCEDPFVNLVLLVFSLKEWICIQESWPKFWGHLSSLEKNVKGAMRWKYIVAIVC